MEIFPGIAVDPDVRFGKFCVAGTRVDVATVVGAIAAGDTLQTVAEEYRLSEEQVQAALRYATHLAGHVPRLFMRSLESSSMRTSRCDCITGSRLRASTAST